MKYDNSFMHLNDAFILTLAYPETIVAHAGEWYSKFLRLLFVGNKTHVRAGHAALVLIDKSTGILEYHDFGRYVTSYPNGRVRGRNTDFELNFPITAEIKNNKIQNLDRILKFLAAQSNLIHGHGNLHASVCGAVDYNLARNYIDKMQRQDFIRYAAFKKNASNCARFVTETIIASTTNGTIKKKLQNSKWFTPSTIGNVVIADTENFIYMVSDQGEISEFNSTVRQENRRLFLDRLKGFNPSIIGTLKPKHNEVKSDIAQWLSGIGGGAWFEIHDLGSKTKYRYKRISPYGNIHCDGIYKIDSAGLDINFKYQFIHYSNCSFFFVEQDSIVYRFDFIRDFESDTK